ncbi:RyR domain-containing protein [Micromonospora sp. NPDC048986]|uniref:RyR domain-containing protein n=1 Tax=Micromonospora sp. NPDC048986 TaxID=3155644 RepID=UPI0033C89696
MTDTDLVELLAEAVHDQWMATKHAQGVTSRRSETGEELMRPYNHLSEPQRDLDRNSVLAVLTAAGHLGYHLTRADHGR